MSVEYTEEDNAEAKKFLCKFAEEHDSIGEDDSLPYKPCCYYVAASELEGECLQWALQYLAKSDAPCPLAASIARTATDEILSGDLTQFTQNDLESKDGVPQMEAADVARSLYNKVNEVCKRWSEDLPKLFRNKHSYETYVYAIKNTRRKMEDKHVIQPEFNSLYGLPQDHPCQAYFAIFDGHGGLDAADYSSSHLHCNLRHQECFSSDAESALREAYVKTDQYFVAKAIREGLRSGSTGVSVFIRDNTMTVGWLGDSQVVMCKDGQGFCLMNPHKPEREDEKERIESLGGCVVWFGAWRVNGTLSVSRAIGDAEHKPYVTGEPDVVTYTFEGDEDFLILACDGLWDSVAPDICVDVVQEYLSEGNSRDGVARMLVERACEKGSSDNISVVVVFLDCHKEEIQNQLLTLSDLSISNPPNNHVNGVENDVANQDNDTTSFQVVLKAKDKITAEEEQQFHQSDRKIAPNQLQVKMMNDEKPITVPNRET